MAISASTVWEVRPATGSDTACSGGFVPGASGTDFSQQTSAQYSLTGLTTGGASATIATASAANDMVGNLIQITAGTNFIVGFYQILSVSVGVSITVDRNATTGVGAAGVGAIGGALATVSKAAGGAAAGNQIYIKGTYTVSAVLAIAFNSNQLDPFTINGYLTARDDGTRATWTTATNSINLVDLSGASNVRFLNINFTNTAGTKGTGNTGNAILALTSNAALVMISHCLFDGFNVGLQGDWTLVAFALVNMQLDNVEIKNSVSHGVVTSASTLGSGCWFHDNGGDGFRIAFSSNNAAYNYTFAFFSCVFYNNTGNGLTNQSNQIPQTTAGGNAIVGIFGCAFVSNGGDGTRITTSQSGGATAWNCIFYGNTGFGINGPNNAIENAVPRCNAFGSNTAGNRNNFPVGVGDVVLSADPFTNKAAGDFSLNSTAGGGTACKGAGFGAFVFGTGHADIGPVQSSGSTTTTVYVVNQQITRYVTEGA